MINNFKKILVLSCLIFLTNCGYAPLLNSEKVNFYINNLSFEGDRKINNYILSNLKKYKDSNKNVKSFDINVASEYAKTVTNRDDNKNPKNYTIKAKIVVKIVSNDGIEKNKTFERKIVMSVQTNKGTEKEMEKKYRKDLSNSLSKDIVFLLQNQ